MGGENSCDEQSDDRAARGCNRLADAKETGREDNARTGKDEKMMR